MSFFVFRIPWENNIALNGEGGEQGGAVRRGILIAPYVEKEEVGYTQLTNYDRFDQILERFITHAKQRYNAEEEYLAKK